MAAVGGEAEGISRERVGSRNKGGGCWSPEEDDFSSSRAVCHGGGREQAGRLISNEKNGSYGELTCFLAVLSSPTSFEIFRRTSPITSH